MNDTDLRNMSVRELRAYRDRVDDAIRSLIARQRAERERGSMKTGEPALQSVDLERERDAWAARRKI